MLTLTRRSTLLALAASVSAAALLLAGCGGESPAATAPAAAPDPTSPPSQASADTGHEVGQKAPGFELTTVDGEQVSLEGFRGQPLLLYFYATW